MIACSGAMALMKMGNCFRVAFYDKQIFVVQYWGSVNGSKTEASGSESTVFLFKNINTKM